MHNNIRIGQLWRSNDPRNARTVKITRILNYVTGHVRNHVVNPQDKVHVENVMTRKTSVIRANNFTSGTRGWSREG